MAIEVEEFVRNTLCQIVAGVVSAGRLVQDTGAEICPPIKTDLAKLAKEGREISHRGLPIREVEFDLAVTASKEKGAKGGIGVVVSVIKLGTEAQTKSQDQRESRIKFSIPLTFPILGKEA